MKGRKSLQVSAAWIATSNYSQLGVLTLGSEAFRSVQGFFIQVAKKRKPSDRNC